jgi:hypothetical protein
MQLHLPHQPADMNFSMQIRQNIFDILEKEVALPLLGNSQVEPENLV